MIRIRFRHISSPRHSPFLTGYRDTERQAACGQSECARHGFYLGYTERWTRDDGKTTDCNVTFYFSVNAGKVIAMYRKVHLPGTVEPLDDPKDTSNSRNPISPQGTSASGFSSPWASEGALKVEDVTKGADLKTLEGKGDQSWTCSFATIEDGRGHGSHTDCKEPSISSKTTTQLHGLRNMTAHRRNKPPWQGSGRI